MSACQTARNLVKTTQGDKPYLGSPQIVHGVLREFLTEAMQRVAVKERAASIVRIFLGWITAWHWVVDQDRRGLPGLKARVVSRPRSARTAAGPKY